MIESVRFLSLDEYGLAVQSLDECWTGDLILARDKKLFDWMFLRPSVWRQEEYSFAVAFSNDVPVGQLGGIPFEFNNFGKLGLGVWTANWSITPKARSGPLGLKLLELFRREAGELVMLFGMAPSIEPLMKELKYQVVPCIPRFLSIFPSGEHLFRKFMMAAYPDIADKTLKVICHHYLLRSENFGECETYRSISEDWDDSAWKVIARKTIGASRDAEFLKWRYRDHPRYQYEIVGVRHEGIPALAIWRKESICNDGGKTGTSLHGNFGRILEVLAPTRSAGQVLARALCQDLINHNVFAADYLGYHGLAGETLLSAGFQLVDEETDSAKIPIRFQPIDTETLDLLSCVLVDAPAPAGHYQQECPWLWTKGDADMDRPRLAEMDR